MQLANSGEIVYRIRSLASTGARFVAFDVGLLSQDFEFDSEEPPPGTKSSKGKADDHLKLAVRLP